MLEAIKGIFKQRSASSLAKYYQSRLETAKSAMEREAVLYTLSLMSLYDWSEQQDEDQK